MAFGNGQNEQNMRRDDRVFRHRADRVQQIEIRVQRRPDQECEPCPETKHAADQCEDHDAVEGDGK